MIAGDPKLTIRTASPADGFLIEALTRDIWKPRVAPPSTVYEETAETVSAQIAKGGGVVLQFNGAPIGSGRWVIVPGPGGKGEWMEVKRIGIRPEFTRRGLGAEILTVLESQGRGRGLQGSQLAVRYDQPRLIAYYVSLGYSLADDVTLTTINPHTPSPQGLRKIFKDLT